MGAGPSRIVGFVASFAPWAALTALAILLSGAMAISQTLWAKVLTLSGSVQIASPTPTATEVPTAEPPQGCSPGFWKQEQHFAQWPAPYLPEGPLAEALGLDALEGNPSLLDGLQDGGGGLAALMRQAIAGILNAAHADLAYPYTFEEVLALIEAAFTTGEFEPVKDMFEAANESECPLSEEVLEVEPTSTSLEATLPPTAPVTPAETPTAEPPTETLVPAEATATMELPTETAEPAEVTPTVEESPTSAG